MVIRRRQKCNKMVKEKKKTKTLYVALNLNQGMFSNILKKIGTRKEFDLSDMGVLRKLLSNERAKILYTLKEKQPKSIYELAKMLERNFRAVRNDVALLDRFGFIELIAEKKGKREMLRPVLAINSLNIIVNI